MADLRAVQQLLARRLPRGLPLWGLAIHRSGLSVPENPAWLAFGQAGMARRPLVVQQSRDQTRLVANPLLVIERALTRRHGDKVRGRRRGRTPRPPHCVLGLAMTRAAGIDTN